MQSGQLLKRITVMLAIGVTLSGNLNAQGSSCTCNCLRQMFDYLIASHHLFIPQSQNTKLAFVLKAAADAGTKIDYRRCALFIKNINKPFYVETTDSVTSLYKARLGDCTIALRATGASVDLYKLVSKDCGDDMRVDYGGPGKVGVIATLQVDSCYTCEVVRSSICVSAITDKPVNPYLYGIAGSWRAAKNYVYYASRVETDPEQKTNIRSDGAINAFVPFWAVKSNKLSPQYDTTKWVWNSESTLFNQRGYEIENRDPLGRYNAGIYGYGNTLPVAVIQNSRYRESAFEGFEDYGFDAGLCDTACSSSRSFDFSGYAGSLDSTEHHTGRYSLRVTDKTPAAISANLVAADNSTFDVTVNKMTDPCTGTSQLLKSITASTNTVLPPFSPLSGKTVLISAWVKEGKDCNVLSYTGSQVGIVVKQGNTQVLGVIARPQGNIIEGWQRFEQVVTLPAEATLVSINLQSLNTDATVYFDDVRIHPYNANMKSFVYNAVNLRLMAELDENNYATFYEYDDDGTLIRVKKETERGIKTIQETRTALLKQ